MPRTWILLKQAIHILMEGTPPEIDMALLEKRLMEIPGVIAAHDLHVWTITSVADAMSRHLVVAGGTSDRVVLAAAQEAMKADFRLAHMTIQIDNETSR